MSQDSPEAIARYSALYENDISNMAAELVRESLALVPRHDSTSGEEADRFVTRMRALTDERLALEANETKTDAEWIRMLALSAWWRYMDRESIITVDGTEEPPRSTEPKGEEQPRSKKQGILATAGIVGLIVGEIVAIAYAIYLGVGPCTIWCGFVAAMFWGLVIVRKKERTLGLVVLAVLALIIAAAAFFLEDWSRVRVGGWRWRR